MEFQHTSILLQESIDFLITDKNGIYVDCTMGGAGHSRGFASQLEAEGLLIGIDQDEDAIAGGSERLRNKFTCKTAVAKSNFENFTQVLDDIGIDQIGDAEDKGDVHHDAPHGFEFAPQEQETLDDKENYGDG